MKDKNHTQLLHIYWTFATNKNYATVITSYRTYFLEEKKNVCNRHPTSHGTLPLGLLGKAHGYY